MSDENVELLMIARWVGEAAARFGGIPGEAAFYAAEAYGFQRGTAACSAFVEAYLLALLALAPAAWTQSAYFHAPMGSDDEAYVAPPGPQLQIAPAACHLVINNGGSQIGAASPRALPDGRPSPDL